MSLEKIRKVLSRSKKKLARLFGVSEIGVFGSYVRGEQKKKSDLDLLVEFKEVPGLFKFIRLENYLTRMLGVKVDLVRKKAVRQELREVIFSEAVYI